MGNLWKIKPLIDALNEHKNWSYSNMSADYSVTELVSAPQYIQLRKRHSKEIALRPMIPKSELSSFRGTAIHSYFEKNLYQYMKTHPNEPYLIERRIWDKILDRKISGKFDVWYNGDLYDFKNTSTWKKIFEDFTDWEAQQNIYALLLNKSNIDVKSVNIVCWYMDYKEPKWGHKPDPKYPDDEVEVIQLNLWTPDEQIEYLEERISLHKDNEDRQDDSLDECSFKEMWSKPSKYAVMKEGAERASRLTETEEAAYSWIKRKGEKDTQYEVVYRPGERTKCETFCECAPWCSQFKEYKGWTNGKT